MSLKPKDTFFSLVNTDVADPESSKIGTCHEADMPRLWTYIQGEEFRGKVQEDLIIVPGAEAKDEMISLYAIRKSSLNDVFPGRQDIDEVSVSLSEDEENYMLLFSFSESGSKKWASMTRMNIGKDIAILSQGKVISAPRITEEIKNGKCSISGKFNESEIKELKAILEN